MKSLKQIKDRMLIEAKEPLFNVGERVHTGNTVTGKFGTVSKTNKHGHTFVTHEDGTDKISKPVATGEDSVFGGTKWERHTTEIK